MNRISVRSFDDMHCHLRLNPLLSQVLPYTTSYANRAIVMPNTRPRAILSAEDVVWYRNEINEALKKIPQQPVFEALMTIEIRDNTTPKMIKEAAKVGTVAGKAYPLGVTTNSDEGMRNFFGQKISDTFRAMQDNGIILLLHGEIDKEKTLVTKREEAFLPFLLKLVNKFPDLKIVMEHVSSKIGVRLIQNLGKNVAATITAHHLCLTLNDVIGYGVRPHNACMPMPKDFEDREALLDAATSGNPKFFLGSDSAPHPREKKECAVGTCGVFSAPVLPAVLAEVFDSVNCLDKLEDFTSRFGAEFYNLPLNQGFNILVKEDWLVPQHYQGITPFKADEKISWRQLF